MHACVSLGIIRNHKNRFHKDTWVVPASPAAAATGVQICVEGGVTVCGRGPCARSAALALVGRSRTAPEQPRRQVLLRPCGCTQFSRHSWGRCPAEYSDNPSRTTNGRRRDRLGAAFAAVGPELPVLARCNQTTCPPPTVLHRACCMEWICGALL